MVKVPKGYRSRNVRDTRSVGGSGLGRSRGGTGLLGSALGGNSMGGSLLSSLGPTIVMGILRSVMGGRGGGGGGLLGSLLGGGGDNAQSELSDAERDAADDQATLLLRAMINAAKADGQLDENEVNAIVGRMGDLDEDEKEFLQHEFSQPVDLDGFVRTVPEEMAQQVYAFSLVGIKVDTNHEVSYLRSLAQQLGLSDSIVDQIHAKFKQPDITG